MSSQTDTLESMSQAVWYNQWTLKKFAKFLKGDILEVGCGIGNFTYSLTNYGKVWAFDKSKEYVEETKKRVNGQAKIGLGDIESGKYFFDEKKFDVAICLNVLEHIKDDKRALRNLHNLLKSKGILILLVPSHPTLLGEIDKTIGHFRRYDLEDLVSLLNSLGFKVIFKKRINFLGAIGWWAAGKILREKKVESNKMIVFNLFAPFFLSVEDLIGTPTGTSILMIGEKQ